jgi:exosortase C (VPDSG-CTERM-specific)
MELKPTTASKAMIPVELKLPPQKTPALPPSLPKLAKQSPPLTGFLFATLALCLCFSVPLYNLIRLAVTDDLYSDIPLIPFISAWLIWLQREKLPRIFASAFKPAMAFITAGLLVAVLYWSITSHTTLSIGNYLALNMLTLLLFFAGLCFFFFGEIFVRAVAFPLALLVFTIPFPDAARHWLETFLQYGSAAVAQGFFQLSGTPVLQNDLNFQFPNCVIHVAPECSGIHSTLVLAITSLIGGWLFLRSPWKRAALAIIVIPLALVRNGFRIFVIGRLCAAYGPQMLASPIHRHGGPLFFVLSLVPLFLLLIFLRKTEPAEPSTKKLL